MAVRIGLRDSEWFNRENVGHTIDTVTRREDASIFAHDLQVYHFATTERQTMVLGSVIQCLFCFKDDSVPPILEQQGTGPFYGEGGVISKYRYREGFPDSRSPTLCDLLCYLLYSGIPLNPTEPRPPVNPPSNGAPQEYLGHFSLTPSPNIHSGVPPSAPEPRPTGPSDLESRQLLDELRKASALGAISNSEQRSDAPRCHKETRTKVLNDLENWSDGKGPWKDVRLLILTGPAGHGKSAIMQSFAERLVSRARSAGEAHVVVATFFFKVSVPERNHAKALVTTLAYQTAEQCLEECPSVRRRIIRVILNDNRIFDKALEDQLVPLLIDPRTVTDPSSLACTFAVDGLDECVGDGEQSRVIRLLHLLSVTPGARVVIASRPEYPIQTTLKSGLANMLHIDLNKEYDSAADIYTFTLAELRSVFPDDGDEGLEDIEGVARKITEYSTGQFVFAATATRFVKDRRPNARQCLKDVLAFCKTQGEDDLSTKSTPRPSRPLENLDKLYSGILERAGRIADPDNARAAQVELASLVWLLTKTMLVEEFEDKPDARKEVPFWVLEKALDFERGDISRKFSDLHSVLDIPENLFTCSDIRAHHKSFLDFLGDQQRSGYLGDIPQVAKHRYDKMLEDNIRRATVDSDIKCLAGISSQNANLPILHFLYCLCDKPDSVLGIFDAEIWKALLPSLTALEQQLLEDWASIGIQLGPWRYDPEEFYELSRGNSQANALLAMINDCSLPKPPPWHARPEALGSHKTTDPRLNNTPRESSGVPVYIPETRHDLRHFPTWVMPSDSWLPPTRALSSLWAPTRHVKEDRNTHSAQRPWIIFIARTQESEHPGGKENIISRVFELFPITRTPGSEKPPIDILLVPGVAGSNSRVGVHWMPVSGNSTPFSYGAPVPCKIEELTDIVDLSTPSRSSASLFQTLTKLWDAKHGNNSHHPHFLIHDLHTLAPEFQAMLLDDLTSGERSSSGIINVSPIFVTITGRLTETIVQKLSSCSETRVYYVDPAATCPSPVAIESGFLQQRNDWSSSTSVSPSQITKLAQIVASSPAHNRYVPAMVSLIRFLHPSGAGSESDWLDRILAAPTEHEVLQVIEEYCQEKKRKQEERKRELERLRAEYGED